MDELTREAYEDWQALLTEAQAGDPRCQAYQPLLEAVAQDPQAARAFPHLSMWTLRLSRCPQYPFDLLGEVDLVEGRTGFYQLNDGPPQNLADTLASLLPLLRSVCVYAGSCPQPEDQG